MSADRISPTVPPSEPVECPFARSDMTPCIIKDGEMCRSDETNGELGVCVGCERRVPQFRSMAEKRRYVSEIAERIKDDSPRIPASPAETTPIEELLDDFRNASNSAYDDYWGFNPDDAYLRARQSLIDAYKKLERERLTPGEARLLQGLMDPTVQMQFPKLVAKLLGRYQNG